MRSQGKEFIQTVKFTRKIRVHKLRFEQAFKKEIYI